jgi:hypothetical protein
VIKRLGLLLGGSSLVWLLVASPAYLLGEERAVVYSAVAVAICLLPAALTLLWAEWTFRKTPDMFLMTILGGTGIRMFVVLGVAFLINNQLTYFQHLSFWLWVLGAYFFTLALETTLLLAGRTGAANQINSPHGE